MCEGGMREEIFFLSWGIDMRKDNIYLYNLFRSTEFIRITLSKISFQLVLVI
jgi:hypothetical protein